MICVALNIGGGVVDGVNAYHGDVANSVIINVVAAIAASPSST